MHLSMSLPTRVSASLLPLNYITCERCADFIYGLKEAKYRIDRELITNRDEGGYDPE
jgi:hypothetical protein